jgi:hypothetical protein
MDLYFIEETITIKNGCVSLQERKIMDLEENLREKDELIRARTQAVTLMSADLSAKGRSTLDQVSLINA